MAQRTVLITGSSTGIGEACASRSTGAGWKVYAGVRRREDGFALGKARAIFIKLGKKIRTGDS